MAPAQVAAHSVLTLHTVACKIHRLKERADFISMRKLPHEVMVVFARLGVALGARPSAKLSAEQLAYRGNLRLVSSFLGNMAKRSGRPPGVPFDSGAEGERRDCRHENESDDGGGDGCNYGDSQV